MEPKPSGENLLSSSVQSDTAKEDTLKSGLAKLSDVDIPLLQGQSSLKNKELSGDESSSLTPPTSQLTNVAPIDLTENEREQKYEFSFVWHGKLHFATCWDRCLLSACERVLCEPVTADRLVRSKTGNYFLIDANGDHWAIKVSPIVNSFTLEDFHLAPEEKKPKRSAKPELDSNDILKGLI